MNITWKNCFKVGVSAFLLFLCIYYWSGISGVIGTALSTVTPIIAGLFIAYVLNILMSFYERHYFTKFSDKKFISASRRPVCLTGAILTLFGIIALIIYLVVPELISCVSFLIAEIPPLIQKLLKSELIRDILPAEVIAKLLSIDWMSNISKIVEAVSSSIGGAVGAVVSAVTSVLSVIVTVFISFIFSVYLLYSKSTLRRQARRLLNTYLPKSYNSGVLHVLRVFNDCFHRYIVGQCIEAVILGLLCTVGMLIFRFPYAGMIGALIGFTALIPVVGAFIGAGVGALMILTVSPLKALLFIVFIIVLQQIETNLIYPKVVGTSIGLPALWVLAAVTVAGGIFGVFGMLIGVPIAAAVYRLVREDLHRKERLQKDGIK